MDEEEIEQLGLDAGLFAESPALVLEAARQAHSKMANGEPKSEPDFLVLVVLSAHADVSASTKLEQLGFSLSFTEDQKRALVSEARLALLSKGDGDLEVRGKISALWRKVEAYRAELRAEAERLLERLRPKLKRSEELFRERTGNPIELVPDPHQLEALALFFKNKNRMLLADDMGLGKTITALLVFLAEEDDSLPGLIVCPASVTFTWAKAASIWLAALGLDIVVIDSPKAEKFFDSPSRRSLVIMSYDRTLTLQHELLAFRFKTVFFDESQLLIRWESQRTKAAIRYRSPTVYRMCLSGTPMPNGRHREIFGQGKILDEDIWSGLETYHDFLQKYGDPKPIRLGKKFIVQFNGRSNEADLGRRLKKLILRRTKAQIGGLPEKTRYAISVPMTPAFRIRYAEAEEAVRREFKARVEKVRSELLEAGVAPQRVEQECKRILAPQMAIITEQERLAVGQMKAEWSVGLVSEFMEQELPTVVFTHHIEVAELAASIYRKKFGDGRVLLGTGQMSARQRFELIERAQEKKECDILVLTRAFSAGVTLTRFLRGVSLQRWWVPGDERQMEDRNYRRGQKFDVAWNYLMMDGTIDDAMGDLQTWKEKGESQIHGAREIRVFDYLWKKTAR